MLTAGLCGMHLQGLTLADRHTLSNLTSIPEVQHIRRPSLQDLSGPATILFISRVTCSDSIAKPFCACFYGVSHTYRAIRCKMGYRRDVPMRNLVPREGVAPFWGTPNLPLKVSRDMGYRSDSIAISRDIGPLSARHDSRNIMR